MEDKRTEDFIVSDISGIQNGKWRWTGKRPTLRVPIDFTDNLHFVMDLVLTDEAFAGRGPVTVSFFVNDHKLESVYYDKPGEHLFEKQIPEEWLKRGNVILAAEVDKLWTRPDGTELGIALVGAGLQQR